MKIFDEDEEAYGICYFTGPKAVFKHATFYDI